jgi:molybdopterin-guanine dinucleotide biosynthesis protein A
MGQDKGLTLWAGQPMVAHVIASAAQVSPHILIVANDADYQQFGYPVVPDEYAAQGPVAGLITGLRHSPHPTNLVLSCDAPMLPPQVLRVILAQAHGHEVTYAYANGRPQPLIGVYRRSCLPALVEQFEAGERKLTQVLHAMAPNRVDLQQAMADFDPRWVMNLNTPEDLRAAEGLN